MFSGDKLLGGPQAGIILGRVDLIDMIRRHPLARAVRIDKASLAALHATLLHYARGDGLSEVPVWRMISMPLGDIERRARRLAKSVSGHVTAGRSMVGGGSLPEESLPTKLVALEGDGAALVDRARRLRLDATPVVGRIEAGALLFDLRTVDPRDDRRLTEALLDAAGADSLRP
jgi:L-seryl-tRNA(Ser) seleniumtransferase